MLVFLVLDTITSVVRRMSRARRARQAILFPSSSWRHFAVLRKMDHFDISFAKWKVSRSRELTKPTLLDPDHFPGNLKLENSINEKN